jgi:MFS transporter, DHA2 family, glioxin efflux transporter
VSAGENIFVNRLVAQVLVSAPEVDPTLVVAVGATGLRQAFTEAELPGIVLSYRTALKSAYAFTIALAGTATIIWCLFVLEKHQGQGSNGRSFNDLIGD